MSATAIDQPTQTEVTRSERTRARRTFRPNVDIVERQDELLVLADMPGACADDIDVNFEHGSLTIFGKVCDRQDANVRFIGREYEVGDYLRTFQVSEYIDADRIAAEFSNGVLTLHLPKAESAKPRKISVKTA